MPDWRGTVLFGAASSGTRLNRKGRGATHWARAAAFRYFKRPVDCDDEESLEERRGRTVLRTAM